jgi:hypothetical protein
LWIAVLIYDKGDDDGYQRSGGALTMEGGVSEGRECWALIKARRRREGKGKSNAKEVRRFVSAGLGWIG